MKSEKDTGRKSQKKWDFSHGSRDFAIISVCVDNLLFAQKLYLLYPWFMSMIVWNIRFHEKSRKEINVKLPFQVSYNCRWCPMKRDDDNSTSAVLPRRWCWVKILTGGRMILLSFFEFASCQLRWRGSLGATPKAELSRMPARSFWTVNKTQASFKNLTNQSISLISVLCT